MALTLSRQYFYFIKCLRFRYDLNCSELTKLLLYLIGDKCENVINTVSAPDSGSRNSINITFCPLFLLYEIITTNIIYSQSNMIVLHLI